MKRRLVEVELHAVHLQELLVLLDERVLRLGQDAHERVFAERFERHDDRQSPDELGNQAVLQQILGQDVSQRFPDVALHLRLDRSAEAHVLLAETRLDDLLDAVKRAAAQEQDVRRVDLNEFLMRMLASALRRYGSHGAFQNLQERLLHALARNIARDGRILRLACDLVDLVDVDDAFLRFLHIVVRRLYEL